jgi:hypothetical protein
VGSDVAAEFRSERLFRVFDFNRSHRQLIIRGDRELPSDPDSRIEIYFGNVSYMALRPIYKGIVVRKPTGEERTSIGERFGIDEESWPHIYAVGDGTPISFVISGQPSWREAKRGFKEPSLFYSDLTSDVACGFVG